MIFNCPGCEAGHTVPVSMIPNGGLDMSCRRCGAPFLAHADGVAQAPLRRDLGSSPIVTHGQEEEVSDTALGASEPEGAAPLKTDRDRSPVFGDSEATLEAESEAALAVTVDGGLNLDAGTVDSGVTVDGVDGAALVDDELDRTQRMPSGVPPRPDVAALAPAAPTPGDKTPVLHLDVEPDPTERGDGLDSQDALDVFDMSGSETARGEDSNSSVYDLVASGEYTPPPPPAPGEDGDDPGGPKAWNEPSSPDLRVGGPLGALAGGLERAPIAMKVALLVFPLALGLTLIMSASDEPEAPIEIPTQPPRRASNGAHLVPAPPAAEGARPTEAATPAPAEPAPTPSGSEELPPEGLPEDRPAPEGYVYTQRRSTQVQARAEPEAPAIARIRRGRLVRRYETRGPWVLVLHEPDGPAGFVLEADLADRPPIAALADEIAFEGCRSPRRRDRAACRARAEASLESCNTGCGDGLDASSDSAEGRCRAACRLAFERCRKGCARRSR